MRAVLVVLLLAACGASSRAPAWPKERAPEDDGGESIAPRASTAALEDDDEEIELDLVIPELKPEPSAKKDDKKPETPTGVTPVGTTPDEPIITTEEIVIEIED